MAYNKSGDIWIMPMDGDRKPQPFLQSPAVEYGAAFSPDGRWMSYISNESGQYELFVVPFPKLGGKWQISAHGANKALWSRNGKELLYDDGKKIMRTDVKLEPIFDFSSPQAVCDLPATMFGFHDMTPDGKKFVIGLAEGSEVKAREVNVVVGWFEELQQKFSGKK